MAGPSAWLRYVRLLNLLTALVQLLAGVGSLTEIFSLDLPATFIAVYVMLFALLLLVFECRFASSDGFLRTNFGFLYSLRGLGAYLLFIGLLDFGMAGGVFGYIAGTSACFTAFVVLSTSACTRASPADGEPSISSSSERLPTYGSSTFGSPTLDPKPAQQAASVSQNIASPPTNTSQKKKKNEKGKK